MKAILEFDLNDQDDERAHLRCIKALDMGLMLWDIRYRLKDRCLTTSNDKKLSKQYQKGVEKVLEELSTLFEEYELNTDSLIN